MLLIKGGKIVGADFSKADILVEDGKITAIAEKIEKTEKMKIIDATGLIIAPGLVDVHVHFRQPGFEYKEDIQTGSAAAAAGGITTCLCMPNTMPVADNAGIIKEICEKAKKAPITVLPIGAVTVGQKGKKLTDFNALLKAGVAALSDDGVPIQNAAVVRSAMKEAKKLGLIIISHCEDEEMVKNYAVNEGVISKKLGLCGRPAIAEEIMVARDIMLAKETGAKLHIAHVSTADSVEIIRAAKTAGVAVTAETCPQYFSLTEEMILTKGTLARVNPPLRTANDVTAIISGLLDGTIDIIASDHAPHSLEEKALPLADAPSGMIGLETSLSVALSYLFHTGKLGIAEIIKLMSSNPAKIFGLDAGELKIGATADIVIFDPNEEWTVEADKFKSKAANTPFIGMTLQGKVKHTISRGEIAYKE